MAKAVLVDVTKCIGCRGCQVACKQWNELPGEKTSFTGGGNPVDLSARTWSRVEFYPVSLKGGQPTWRSVKTQCMHCEEPTCVSVCPVAAMKKTPEGPVVHDPQACIGCRYCMLACPFGIPSFEWDETMSLVRKCTMCHDRIVSGQEPSCVSACPAGALIFGERSEMIALAEKKIAGNPDKYVAKVYGKEEVGGTSWLYISDAPFEQMGFNTTLAASPLPPLTWDAMTKVPWIIAGGSVLLTGLYLYTSRRNELEGRKGE